MVVLLDYRTGQLFFSDEYSINLLPAHNHLSSLYPYDNPLVTLALTLDGSGFPCNVEILPGNASEPSTLKQAIEKLDGETPTVIMDVGIATEENRAYLKEQGLDWICVERTKTPPVPTTDPEAEFTTAGKTKIRAWRLPEEDGEHRVYVHSEARQITAEQILEAKCAKFEAELENLHAGLSKPRYLKNYEKVLVKVGRLKEEYKKVSHLYEVTITKDPKKKGRGLILFCLNSALQFIKCPLAYGVKDCLVSSMGGF